MAEAGQSMGQDARLYRRLLGEVKPYWRRLATAMVMMALVGGASAAMAYLVKPILDDVFVPPHKPEMLTILPMLIIGVFAIKGLSAYGQLYLMQAVGQSIVTSFRVRLFAHLQRLSLSYFDSMPTGALISRITNDVTHIQNAVSSTVTGLLKDAFAIVGLVFVLFYHDWLLAIFALGVFPVCLIPLIKFGQRLRRISTRTQESMADVSVIIHETMAGQRIVKGFCREDYETERFTKEAQRLLRLRLKDVSIRAISSPLMEFLGGLGIGFIIYYGGSQVIEGHSTTGTFFSFLTALFMLYEPVKRLSNLNNDIQMGLAAATRVYQVLDTEPEIVDRDDAIELPRLERTIRFEGVYFSYASGDEVLHDINLTVHRGEVLALVGTSGGGKTTLVNLLPRFYEVSQGRVTFDGVDIRQATLHSLRRQIAIVTQQTILFNDTVRTNITYGRPGADQEELRAAAEAAYALDFIEGLPEGFDTKIGEGGVRLSGGERQRLSIARALLADRPVLILDEATSSLDTESELQVQKALENLMKGRTTFVIAHRLSTVQRADRIVVIDGGRIVEEGNHEALLARRGVYHRLYQMQFDVDRGLEVADEA